MNAIMTYLFSSESVSEGHPDKLCDQISDAVLDAALTQDPESRVAVETFTTTGLVVVGGELTTKADIPVQRIVRDVLKKVGYTHSDYGIEYESCAVMSSLHEQSSDIAQGVNKGEGLHKEIGAGDQGIMFGHACKQTPTYMPLPIDLSHKLLRRLALLRKNNDISYLRPDAKAQVTVKYDGRTPVGVDTVVISTQHAPEVSHQQIENDMIESVVKEVIPKYMLGSQTKYLINPTGRFVIGGPHGDAGLTGRKIIVDTYGGWASHGGGAFSGKDATKVDRSGAYMARYISKNIVAAGIADEIQIQLAYAIGVAEPVSIHVQTFGTGTLSDHAIIKLIRDYFELTPEGIIRELDLKQPIFSLTAAYGHFGRDDIEFSWESLNKVDELKEASSTLLNTTTGTTT
jgi:S-adenosylmethionine synthetase